MGFFNWFVRPNPRPGSDPDRTSPSAALAAAERAIEEGDLTAALKLLTPLAESGNADAQCQMGVLAKAQRKYATAAVWYRKAAEQGHPEAAAKLGLLYRTGKGVVKDDAEGTRWYRKSAEKGYAEAQFNLGQCLLHGAPGVNPDVLQAIDWFRRAAFAGYASAQYNLGICYLEGRGGMQDLDQAIVWLKKAAEQGVVDAQMNLATIYLAGQKGVPDFAQGIFYLRQAAAGGDRQAIEVLRKNAERFQQAGL